MTGEEQSEGVGLQAGRSEAEVLLDKRQGGDEMAEGEEGTGSRDFKNTIWWEEGKSFPDICWFVELGRWKCFAEGI